MNTNLTISLKDKISNFLPGKEIDDHYTLENQRLMVTRLDMDGLDDMHEYSKKDIFYRNLNIDPHKTIDDTKRYLEDLILRTKKGYAGGDAMYWFVRLKNSKKVIGTFGFIGLNEKNKSVQIGKGLSPDYWGKGYVYELLGIMLSYAFNVLELKYIYSMTQKNNIANIKSMEKGGFKIVELIDDYVDNIGEISDSVKLLVTKKDSRPNICFNLAFQKYNSL